MARLVGEYRGYDLWRTWKTITYTKSDGTTSKSQQACYTAIHKEGKYPPIRSSTCMRRYLVEKRIDEALEKPPEPPLEGDVYEVPEDVPRVVDTYNGVPIYYHPSTGKYHATVAGHTKKCDDQDAAHAFIDHEQYINSPEYLQAKADEKAEQEAALERARIYGIGTDDEGNEIPPSEEEIEARETYYAQVRVSSKGDTVRQAYEKREGITLTEEEIEIREEYEEAELEKQGKWLDLFWLRLKAECRDFMNLVGVV